LDIELLVDAFGLGFPAGANIDFGDGREGAAAEPLPKVLLLEPGLTGLEGSDPVLAWFRT
jgi:hypothetical protein